MRKQQGFSLIGLIMVSAVMIGAAVLGMKIAPSVMEYLTVMKHIKAIAASGEGHSSIAEVRKSYDRRSSVENTPSVSANDLDISKDGNELVIAFQYSNKIPIAGNVSVCIDFSGSTAGSRRAAQ